MAVIELSGLTKRFGSLTAVDHLSFAIEPGQVVGFLGPNGAGKTTSLRMLLGLVAPTSGTATINGQAYRELPDPCTQWERPSSRPSPTRAAAPATTSASTRSPVACPSPEWTRCSIWSS